MVRKHHVRNVPLIAFTSLWLTAAAFGAEDAARAIITDARRGNCTICHEIPLADFPDTAFGNLGPSLAAVGSRLTPLQIRDRIVDPRRSSPMTVMPPYGSIEQLYRVQAAYRDKPILTDQEIDAVVAYLSSLK
jgi:L-cysteine S-thiosulfotransferase